MSSESPTPPFLVARDTPTGFRFVRPAGAKAVQYAGGALVGWYLKGSIGLLAAGVVAVYILAKRWEDLPDWAHVIGPVYVAQLVLDLGLMGRYLWRAGRYLLGRLEIEVANDQLRAGRRWGKIWIDAPYIALPSLRRLVIVRRLDADSAEPGTTWDLVADPQDGKSVTLISVYDEPVLVRDLATELHARLSTSPELAGRLPPLSEEERPNVATPPVAKTNPGGGWLWLCVHVVGLVGLWPIARQGWNWPDSIFLRAASAGMVLLQGLIIAINVAGIQFARQRASAATSSPPDSSGGGTA